MPTKKQQRRRQKQKRHEYEEVYVDETGRELDPEEAEEIVGASAPRKSSTPAKGRPVERGGRKIDPPSWRRTFRRAALFAPVMLAVVYILPSAEGTTAAGKIFTTVMLLAFFIPFSYFMDSVLWRSYQRSLARTGEKKS